MTTKYHAVANDYGKGEDIYSFSALEQMGCEPVWKWDDEPFETDWVSLADTLDEAIEIAQDHGLTRVLVLDWELVEDHCTTGRNSEGYWTAGWKIPADCIVEIINV
jgi:hypothetical protein